MSPARDWATGLVLGAVAATPVMAGTPVCARWLPIGGVLNGAVRTIGSYDPDGDGPQRRLLVIGGEFTTINGTPCGGIAAWDGESWSTFGQGTDGAVWSLHEYDGLLLVGGVFGIAGGIDAGVNGLAAWNGSQWQAYGGALSTSFGAPVVSDMVTFQNELIIAGKFTNVAGVGALHVARRSGNTWQVMGSGVGNTGASSRSFALCEHNGSLYVAGTFTRSGTTSTGHVARWTGSSWIGVGNITSGGTGSVNALLSYNNTLVAGGTIGGSDLVAYIGNAWVGFDDAPDHIRSLTQYGERMIVGGTFTTIGATDYPGLAAWDGTTWEALGSGVDCPDPCTPEVSVVRAFGPELIVGGMFQTAGGMTSAYLGRWTDTGIPWFIDQPQSLSVKHEETVELQGDVASGYDFDGPLSYEWRRNGEVISDGVAGASTNGGVVSGASTLHITILGAWASDSGVYECRAINTCGIGVSDAAQVMVAPPPTCFGDTNADNVVNGADLSVLLSQFNQNVTPGSGADFNSDGVVNGSDLSVLLARFGSSC